MTTREIYFKNVSLSDLSYGMVGYVRKNEHDIIQLANYVNLKFSTEEEIVNKAINKMKKIENKEGFMFWYHSPEGEAFFYRNNDGISKIMFKTITD